VPTPQPAQQNYTLLLLEYLDVLQEQKKMYESAVQPEKKLPDPVQTSASAFETAYTTYKNLGMQCFKHTVETQLGLWRLFQRRRSAYMALPDAILSCRSPADILASQASFLKQLVEDHANEGTRMMQSYSAYMPWAAFGYRR
jgi:hypothetical protein